MINKDNEVNKVIISKRKYYCIVIPHIISYILIFIISLLAAIFIEHNNDARIILICILSFFNVMIIMFSILYLCGDNPNTRLCDKIFKPFKYDNVNNDYY